MSTKNLINRVGSLEQKVNPETKLLIVIVNQDDDSCEAAKLRVMCEQNMTEISNGCTVYILNLLGKPLREG